MDFVKKYEIDFAPVIDCDKDFKYQEHLVEYLKGKQYYFKCKLNLNGVKKRVTIFPLKKSGTLGKDRKELALKTLMFKSHDDTIPLHIQSEIFNYHFIYNALSYYESQSPSKPPHIKRTDLLLKLYGYTAFNPQKHLGAKDLGSLKREFIGDMIVAFVYEDFDRFAFEQMVSDKLSLPSPSFFKWQDAKCHDRKRIHEMVRKNVPDISARHDFQSEKIPLSHWNHPYHDAFLSFESFKNPSEMLEREIGRLSLLYQMTNIIDTLVDMGISIGSLSRHSFAVEKNTVHLRGLRFAKVSWYQYIGRSYGNLPKNFTCVADLYNHMHSVTDTALPHIPPLLDYLLPSSLPLHNLGFVGQFESFSEEEIRASHVPISSHVDIIEPTGIHKGKFTQVLSFGQPKPSATSIDDSGGDQDHTQVSEPVLFEKATEVYSQVLENPERLITHTGPNIQLDGEFYFPVSFLPHQLLSYGPGEVYKRFVGGFNESFENPSSLCFFQSIEKYTSELKKKWCPKSESLSESNAQDSCSIDNDYSTGSNVEYLKKTSIECNSLTELPSLDGEDTDSDSDCISYDSSEEDSTGGGSSVTTHSSQKPKLYNCVFTKSRHHSMKSHFPAIVQRGMPEFIKFLPCWLIDASIDVEKTYYNEHGHSFDNNERALASDDRSIIGPQGSIKEGSKFQERFQSCIGLSSLFSPTLPPFHDSLPFVSSLSLGSTPSFPFSSPNTFSVWSLNSSPLSKQGIWYLLKKKKVDAKTTILGVEPHIRESVAKGILTCLNPKHWSFDHIGRCLSNYKEELESPFGHGIITPHKPKTSLPESEKYPKSEEIYDTLGKLLPFPVTPISLSPFNYLDTHGDIFGLAVLLSEIDTIWTKSNDVSHYPDINEIYPDSDHIHATDESPIMSKLHHFNREMQPSIMEEWIKSLPKNPSKFGANEKGKRDLSGKIFTKSLAPTGLTDDFGCVMIADSIPKDASGGLSERAFYSPSPILSALQVVVAKPRNYSQIEFNQAETLLQMHHLTPKYKERQDISGQNYPIFCPFPKNIQYFCQCVKQKKPSAEMEQAILSRQEKLSKTDKFFKSIVKIVPSMVQVSKELFTSSLPTRGIVKSRSSKRESMLGISLASCLRSGLGIIKWQLWENVARNLVDYRDGRSRKETINNMDFSILHELSNTVSQPLLSVILFKYLDLVFECDNVMVDKRSREDDSDELHTFATTPHSLESSWGACFGLFGCERCDGIKNMKETMFQMIEFLRQKGDMWKENEPYYNNLRSGKSPAEVFSLSPDKASVHDSPLKSFLPPKSLGKFGYHDSRPQCISNQYGSLLLSSSYRSESINPPEHPIETSIKTFHSKYSTAYVEDQVKELADKLYFCNENVVPEYSDKKVILPPTDMSKIVKNNKKWEYFSFKDSVDDSTAEGGGVDFSSALQFGTSAIISGIVGKDKYSKIYDHVVYQKRSLPAPSSYSDDGIGPITNYKHLFDKAYELSLYPSSLISLSSGPKIQYITINADKIKLSQEYFELILALSAFLPMNSLLMNRTFSKSNFPVQRKDLLLISDAILVSADILKKRKTGKEASMVFRLGLSGNDLGCKRSEDENQFLEFCFVLFSITSHRYDLFFQECKLSAFDLRCFAMLLHSLRYINIVRVNFSRNLFGEPSPFSGFSSSSSSSYQSCNYASPSELGRSMSIFLGKMKGERKLYDFRECGFPFQVIIESIFIALTRSVRKIAVPLCLFPSTSMVSSVDLSDAPSCYTFSDNRVSLLHFLDSTLQWDDGKFEKSPVKFCDALPTTHSYRNILDGKPGSFDHILIGCNELAHLGHIKHVDVDAYNRLHIPFLFALSEPYPADTTKKDFFKTPRHSGCSLSISGIRWTSDNHSREFEWKSIAVYLLRVRHLHKFSLSGKVSVRGLFTAFSKETTVSSQTDFVVKSSSNPDQNRFKMKKLCIDIDTTASRDEEAAIIADLCDFIKCNRFRSIKHLCLTISSPNMEWIERLPAALSSRKNLTVTLSSHDLSAHGHFLKQLEQSLKVKGKIDAKIDVSTNSSSAESSTSSEYSSSSLSLSTTEPFIPSELK
ncbi:hypothetical protein ADUPG1_012510 [Aduncisulcus paluster]|uniref:Uncharacterized protein n=1 Tax=Aduncisulcus paluster TaxID=2918883 RepID=A0ABQ5K303_9EUKA|nr:hypothetical protein ADUPG1_012510 [Aduncisulcus paluster]